MTWCEFSKICLENSCNKLGECKLVQHCYCNINPSDITKKIVFTLWFLFFNSSYLYIILVHSRMDFHERLFPKVKQSPKAWTSCPYWHNMSKMPFLKFYSLLRKKLGFPNLLSTHYYPSFGSLVIPQ